MFARLAAAALMLAAAGDRAPPPPERDLPEASMAEWADACADDDPWDKPGPPFHVHGNTWYVGTCAIAAILITGDDGHVLIDSGTQAGAAVVAANIDALGFRIEDVEILLLSHEHIDHAGGMARLQALTGARVIATPRAATVLRSGAADAEDPQAGLFPPLPVVANVEELPEDNAVTVGELDVFALRSPGHTPGAASWFWRSCDADGCLDVMYADSLSPISRDGYRFSDHPEYVATYRASLATLATHDCDLLLSPHPSASQMRERLIQGALAAPPRCAEYAASRRELLDRRLAEEAAGK